MGPRVAARLVSAARLFCRCWNYRAANCPSTAASCHVGVECPAALFYISAQPKPSMLSWLVIAHVLLVINGEIRNWSVRPVPPAFYVAALLLLSLPCLTSIIDIYVLRALHRVRVQLPVRHLQQYFRAYVFSWRLYWIWIAAAVAGVPLRTELRCNC